MKKIIMMTFILIVSLIGCTEEVQEYWFSDTPFCSDLTIKNYSDLEIHAHAIIRVGLDIDQETLTKLKENEITVNGVTKSYVVIKEVIKNNGKLKVGDIIPIWEDYYLTENEFGRKYYMAMEGYRPMKVDREYVLFVYEPDMVAYQSAYALSDSRNGKYPVDVLLNDNVAELTSEACEIGEEQVLSYKKMINIVKNGIVLNLD